MTNEIIRPVKSFHQIFALFLFSVGFFILFLLNPSVSNGQEIGIEYGITNAGYQNALELPDGFGVHLDLPIINNPSVPVIDRAGLRLAVSRHTEQQSIFRSPCTGLVQPGQDCTNETFDGNANITRFGAGVVIRFQSPIFKIRPEIYALGIRTDIHSKFESRESNESLNPGRPVEETYGYEFGASLQYQVTRFLNLYGRFGMQHPNIQVCGEDGWFAFCEDRQLYQFTLGAQLGLSELWQNNRKSQ